MRTHNAALVRRPERSRRRPCGGFAETHRMGVAMKSRSSASSANTAPVNRVELPVIGEWKEAGHVSSSLYSDVSGAMGPQVWRARE
jgi:hypothetical protein